MKDNKNQKALNSPILLFPHELYFARILEKKESNRLFPGIKEEIVMDVNRKMFNKNMEPDILNFCRLNIIIVKYFHHSYDQTSSYLVPLVMWWETTYPLIMQCGPRKWFWIGFGFFEMVLDKILLWKLNTSYDCML